MFDKSRSDKCFSFPDFFSRERISKHKVKDEYKCIYFPATNPLRTHFWPIHLAVGYELELVLRAVSTSRFPCYVLSYFSLVFFLEQILTTRVSWVGQSTKSLPPFSILSPGRNYSPLPSSSTPTRQESTKLPVRQEIFKRQEFLSFLETFILFSSFFQLRNQLKNFK